MRHSLASLMLELLRRPVPTKLRLSRVLLVPHLSSAQSQVQVPCLMSPRHSCGLRKGHLPVTRCSLAWLDRTALRMLSWVPLLSRVPRLSCAHKQELASFVSKGKQAFFEAHGLPYERRLSPLSLEVSQRQAR